MDDSTSFGESIETDDSVPGPLQSESALHEPFDWYSEMRNTAPVHYDPERGVYDVFSYQHVKTCLEDGAGFLRPNLSENDSVQSEPMSYIDTAIVWMDGNAHSHRKGQMFPFFQPSSVAELQERIEAIVEEQIRLAMENGSAIDFVEEFASPVPLRVIMELVGVPDADRDRVLDWLLRFRDQKHSEFGRFGDGEPSQMAPAVAYFRDLVASRKRDPQDDLISELVTETDLDDATIGANCFNLILAGQGTLTNLLSNAVYVFARRDRFGRLGNYDMATVLEEVLRYRAPLQSRARVTAADITLGGTEIPAGETVILWVGSANRDPAEFTHPDRFIPNRDPAHLSFGRGPHTCIGAPLARLEARIALRALCDRFDSVSIDDSYQPTANPSELGFERLPVKMSL